MQHVKCILRATSDGWQACLHGIRSRRRAVTDQRWTLCLLLLTPSEYEMEMKNHQTVHVCTPNCYSTISILRSFRMLISANEFCESVTVVCIHYSCDQCTDRIGTSEGEVCAGCARCCAHGEVVLAAQHVFLSHSRSNTLNALPPLGYWNQLCMW